MALVNGFTSPIADTSVWEIRRTLLVTDLFHDKDEFAMNFIGGYREQFPEED